MQASSSGIMAGARTLLLVWLVSTATSELAAQGLNGRNSRRPGFGSPTAGAPQIGFGNGAFPTGDAAANEGPRFDGKVDVEQLATMQGQPMVLHLRSGLRIEDAKFAGVVTDPRSDSIRFIEYQQGRRTTKKRSEDIYRIFVQGRPNHLRYHGPTRSYHWIDETVAEVQSMARLEKLRYETIEPTSPESLTELNAQNQQFLQEGLRKLNNPHLRVEENDYAILITDFSVPQTRAFSQMIPAVFAYLNQQFGVPQNQTVLPGKAIIAFFGQRQNFAAFETVVMDNPNFGNTTTFWHFGGDRFVVARHNPVFDDDSVHKICMALADGYFSRIHSTAPLPEWVSVGLRATVADAALPPNPRARRGERAEVALQLRQQRSLDSILQATMIPPERRLLAKILVEDLIRRDPMSLPQFIADLKTGQPAEAALELNYGLSHALFAAQLGASLGIPGLQP